MIHIFYHSALKCAAYHFIAFSDTSPLKRARWDEEHEKARTLFPKMIPSGPLCKIQLLNVCSVS